MDVDASDKQAFAMSSEGILFTLEGTRKRQWHAHDTTIHGIALQPHGDLLASVADEGIKLWRQDKLVRKFEAPKEGLHFVDFSHDGKHVVGAVRGGPIMVWNVANGDRVLATPAQKQSSARFPRATFSPDGRFVAPSPQA